jgi:hypothetical protein
MSIDVDDLNESLGAFESALTASKVHIAEPSVAVVLLAIDGSSQDANAIAYAGLIAKRFSARVAVTIGTEGELTDEAHALAERAVDILHAEPYGLEAKTVFSAARFPGRQILECQRDLHAGLIVLPAPYLIDVDVLGDESLSSPIDLLLAESDAPLFLVRHPNSDPNACFRRIVLPMTIWVPALGAAAGWAFRLVAPGGRIELFAVADKQAMEHAMRVLNETDDRAMTADALLRAEHHHIGGMVSALQHRGVETGVDVDVDVAVGKALKLTLERIHGSPSIVCTGVPADRSSEAYHRIQDIVLGSHTPVLVART